MMASYEDLFDSSITLEQDEWTQDALAGIPACKGVLLFVDDQNRPIQILQSANLRRLARSRITPPQESPLRKTDVASLTRKIGWLGCHNDFMTQMNYIRLVHAVFNKTADSWIQLPTPSFAAINLDATLPYFYVSGNPETSENRIVYGLFPNRKATQKYAETLNAAFNLCRNPSLLKTSKQSGCPYLQMGQCPGPCLDPEEKKRYLSRVHEILRSECRHTEPAIRELDQQMRQAAGEMDFEKANALKKQIVLLSKLRNPDYRWVHNLKDLSILHVDRDVKESVEGKKRKVQQYRWLKIVSDAVYDLGRFVPESHEDIERFLEKNWITAPKIHYAANSKEHLCNLAYFLFRSKPAGLWFDCTEGIFADQLYPTMDDLFQSHKSPDSAKK